MGVDESKGGITYMAYAKSLLAVLVTVISAVVAAMTDNAVSTTEWINVAIAGVGAAAVFAAPNVPGSRYTKAVLAVLTAVLTFIVTVVTDGITTAEWLQVLVIAAGAIGVYAVPNKPTVIGQPSVL
jgi:phosphate/sulfate permease